MPDAKQGKTNKGWADLNTCGPVYSTQTWDRSITRGTWLGQFEEEKRAEV